MRAIGTGVTLSLSDLGARELRADSAASPSKERLMRMGRDEGRAGVKMFHTGREEAIILYPNSGRMNFGRRIPLQLGMDNTGRSYRQGARLRSVSG